jgi:ketosteroid isomerase-like protein
MTQSGAVAMAQCVLDDLGEAILAHDFAEFARLISLPFVALRSGDTTVVGAPQELQARFDEMSAGQRALGVQLVTRVVTAVRVLSGDLWQVDYECTIIAAGGRVLLSSSRGVCLMRADLDGVWRLAMNVDGALEANAALGDRVGVDTLGAAVLGRRMGDGLGS